MPISKRLGEFAQDKGCVHVLPRQKEATLEGVEEWEGGGHDCLGLTLAPPRTECQIERGERFEGSGFRV